MRPLDILYDDEHCLACAKPPGLLTVAPPKSSTRTGEATLVERLRAEGHVVLAVHRLDRETSGVVLLAKSAAARTELMALFKDRKVSKTYWGVAQGHLEPPEGAIKSRILDLGDRARIDPKGQAAETRYRTLERRGGCSVLELELLTGRHNQARLHLASLGRPLVGERKYAYGRDAATRHKRVALHALRVAFRPSWTAHDVLVEAPLPADLENLLERLGDPASRSTRRP